MLGAFPFWKCSEAAVDLALGDTLVLYSDGVTEAGMENDDEFGETRLKQALMEIRGAPANTIVQQVVERVSKFGGAHRSDDVTVVALRAL